MPIFKWTLATSAILAVALFAYPWASGEVDNFDLGTGAGPSADLVARSPAATAPAAQEQKVDPARQTAAPAAKGKAPAAAPKAIAQEKVRVRFRFVDEAGNPIAGVKLQSPPNKALGSEYTTSDADGYCTWSENARTVISGFGQRHFQAFAAGFANDIFASAQPVRVAETAKNVEGGVITLLRGGTVRGRVLNADGEGVEGVTVDCDMQPRRGAGSGPGLGRGFAEAKTVRDGSFTLEGLLLGAQRLRVTRREGYVIDIRHGVAIRAGEVTSTTVRLKPAPKSSESIQGVVLGVDGKALRGVSVEAKWKSWLQEREEHVTSDENGRFTLSASKSKVRIFASHKSGRALVASAAHGQHLTLRLRPRMRVAVKVSGTSQLRGHKLVVHDIATNVMHRKRTASGNSVIDLPLGEFYLIASAPGYEEKRFGPYFGDDVRQRLAAERGGAPIPKQRRDRDAPVAFELELEGAPALRGSVSYKGKPLSNAHLELYRYAENAIHIDNLPSVLAYRPVAQTRSDANGTYAMPLRAAGEYVLRVSHKKTAPSELKITRALKTDDDVVKKITLSDGAVIQGRLLSAKPAGQVIVISRGDGKARVQKLGEDGHFRFERVMPGRYLVANNNKVTGRANGWTVQRNRARVRDLEWNCEVAEGESKTLDIAAQVQSTVEGRLTYDGVAAQGWGLLLADASGGTWQVQAPLRADGSFRQKVDASPRYGLTLWKNEGAIATRIESAVSAKSTTKPLKIDIRTGALHLNFGAHKGSRSPVICVTALSEDRVAYSIIDPTKAKGVLKLRVPIGECSVRSMTGKAISAHSSNSIEITAVAVKAEGSVVVRIP